MELVKCNLVIVFSKDLKRLLFCRRRHEPYTGTLNFVGGHIEENESGTEAAYRELFEETGIPKSLISLKHLATFDYYFSRFHLETYVGRLKEDFEVFGEENELVWEDWDRHKTYFSIEEYAGAGSVGHLIEEVKYHWDEIFSE